MKLKRSQQLEILIADAEIAELDIANHNKRLQALERTQGVLTDVKNFEALREIVLDVRGELIKLGPKLFGILDSIEQMENDRRIAEANTLNRIEDLRFMVYKLAHPEPAKEKGYPS